VVAVRKTPLITEWDYGGTTTEEIRKTVPDWLVWTHGCPGGETVARVCQRADWAIAVALEHMQSRDVLFVGHGHFSRAVLIRWIEQPLYEGIRFAMAATSIAVCGFEHNVRQIIGIDITGCPRPLSR
jgi:broad specificity phosphatase PhoE